MYLWVFSLLTATCFYPIHLKLMYGHDIQAYEIINPKFKEVDTNRNMYLTEDYKWNKEFDVEMQFQAFNKSFHLLLYEDLLFQKIQIKSYVSHKSSKSLQDSCNFYEGFLNDSSFDSRVSGYLKNGIFIGIITANDTTYFMESADLFFPNYNHSGKIVIYKSKDNIQLEEYQTSGDISNEIPKRNTMFPFRGKGDNYYYFKRINKTGIPDENRTCQIEMVADHTLYEYFKKDESTVSAFLYLHAKYTDSIFRKTDFDGDGFPDNIRIVVKNIFIYKSINDPNYPMARVSSLLEFLKNFSKRTQYFCLSICICHRHYSSKVVGRAYKPTPGRWGAPGGICQRPVIFQRDGFRVSLNTGVVTIVNSQGTTFPLITTLLAVSHEIGHSFGSDHDLTENLFCSPGGDKGHYLMHPKTSKKVKELSNVFSPCSRRDMYKIIKERGSCLKSSPSICGNGIREGNEECDCGWEKICKHIDHCCTPSDAKAPEKGCTFRNKTGVFCSPEESLCCTKDCTVNKEKDKICYESDTSCLISYCDQKSAVCPVPDKAPDKHPCLKSSRTCNRGFCNSSVCLDNDLEECNCEKWHSVCFVCCLKDRQCKPAHKFGLLTPWNSPFVHVEGTRCNGSRNYRCDGTGRCIDVKTRVQLDKDEKVMWWGLSILVFVFFLLLTIFVCLLIQHLKSYFLKRILYLFQPHSHAQLLKIFVDWT
ncbi:disintegrin and metalloproteinase domain-containing protein 10 [Nephila pilipes]|uniref:Disintegrin and metalloproteinase domain-containing protein 10 n=1 Tax=Nephila pilipes TaxID=299642 RepID=A0A8X6PRM6_NEPPI|nr:disintegrin and metalloproteinase domain-containing protein 10 [Nephila pilipes]